jgi:hypothetical protein
MRVECPCGSLVKHTGNPSTSFADFLPSVLSDAYCEVIESAILTREREVAAQYVIDGTTDLFRRMCQCPSCGRIFIEDENFGCHEFVPAGDSVSRALFTRSRPSSRPDGPDPS